MLNKFNPSKKGGFTLLELLIVIAIIAILSVILILVLDPAETLRKSRDSQRIADLGTLKTALGIWTTTTSTPYLGGATSNTACKTGSNNTGGTYISSTSKVFYSVGVDTTAIASGTTAAIDLGPSGVASSSQTTSGSSSLIDGTGWIPVNLSSLTGGSPISNLPIDPTNSVTAAQPVNSDLVYRYTCNASTTKWEADATLESVTFTTAPNNKMSSDGGNNNNVYEVGTDLKLLGSGNF